MLISVIIPTLNEADWLSGTLDSVVRQPGPKEIIVADGTSTDHTRVIAQRRARVVSSARGRAVQMNAAASVASGDTLLFLHADTRLCGGALEAVRHALADPIAEGGIFRLRFDTSGFWPATYTLFARIHWRHICFGDRGLFVRRSVFEKIGGYPEIPIFEDLHLACMLHVRGGFRYLQTPVTTAWRRFAHVGALRQQGRNLRLWLQYMSGTPPLHLAHRYPNHNPSDELSS